MPSLSSGRPLATILQREHNNLDLFRLLAAVLVIFGHAYVFPPASQPAAGSDPFGLARYPGIYSGSIAVKIFFFISGLLVTDSLLRKGSASGFILGRFFRIWPALVVTVLLTAFVVGPWFSSWNVGSYLRNPAPAWHVLDNVLLHPNGNLPGVFTHNPQPDEVNGSLWTLAYEVAAYAWLLALVACGATRHGWIVALLVTFTYVDPLLPHPLLPTSQTGNPQIAYLPSCFALGAAMAYWKNLIRVRWEYPVAAGVVFLFLRHTLLGPHLLILTILLAVLHLSALPAILRLRPRADLSYGIYLWGFPIQQMIAASSWGASAGFAACFLVTLGVAVTLAWLSWHGVEKPAIALGRRLAGGRARQESAGNELGRRYG